MVVFCRILKRRVRSVDAPRRPIFFAICSFAPPAREVLNRLCPCSRRADEDDHVGMCVGSVSRELVGSLSCVPTAAARCRTGRSDCVFCPTSRVQKGYKRRFRWNDIVVAAFCDWFCASGIG